MADGKFPDVTAMHMRLRDLLGRLKPWEWVLTLVAVYAVHYFFVSYFIAGNVADLIRPFPGIPAYIYNGWDSVLYRNLYNNYDRFNWPPLYPFALRLVTFVFGLEEPNAYEKSALLLNVASHAAIVAGLVQYVKRDDRLASIAPWVIAFFLFFFPFHNVFFAAYSESFYLALTLVAFLLHQKGRVGFGSLFAGLASLVRMMGSFLALAFIAEQVFYCIRDRRIYWRKLLFSSLGVAVVIGWHGTLNLLGTTAVASNTDWISDLLVNHVPQGANPKLWVLRYLAFSPRIFEVVAFWASMLAILYCARKKRYLEMFYIGTFNLSLVFYLYRPFAWTRYVSVLFPIYIMLADWLQTKPRLTTALLLMSTGTCYFVQRKLFMGQMGEP